MTYIVHLSDPGVNVVIDRSARLVALQPGLPVSGAIMARRMSETIWRPEFDGETLLLDAYGLVAVRGWIMRYHRHHSPKAQLARFRSLVHDSGTLIPMLREINALIDGTDDSESGEPNFVRGRVVEQMACGAFAAMNGPRADDIQARLSEL